MRDHLRSSGSGYLVAGLATAAAFGVRLLLDPLLGDHLPYLTFFAAVVAAAWHGGWWPGLLATLASLLLAWFFFVPARLSFSVADGPHQIEQRGPGRGRQSG